MAPREIKQFFEPPPARFLSDENLRQYLFPKMERADFDIFLNVCERDPSFPSVDPSRTGRNVYQVIGFLYGPHDERRRRGRPQRWSGGAEGLGLVICVKWMQEDHVMSFGKKLATVTALRKILELDGVPERLIGRRVKGLKVRYYEAKKFWKENVENLRPVASIDTVLKCLKAPIWETKPETAKRLAAGIETVLDWAEKVRKFV